MSGQTVGDYGAEHAAEGGCCGGASLRGSELLGCRIMVLTSPRGGPTRYRYGKVTEWRASRVRAVPLASSVPSMQTAKSVADA